MADTRDHSPTDRREFLKLLGIAGISSTLAAPVLALAQTPKPDVKEGATPKPQPVSPPADEPEEVSPDARSMLDIVKRRYGEHLTDEQLDEILEELNFRIRAGATLRKLDLANGDEPDFIFSA